MFHDEAPATTSNQARLCKTIRIEQREYELLYKLYMTLWDTDQQPDRTHWQAVVEQYKHLTEFYAGERD